MEPLLQQIHMLRWSDPSWVAERYLYALVVEAQRTLVEGPQLGGAIVANVESFGLCEERENLDATVELVEARLTILQFAPGLQITADVVA